MFAFLFTGLAVLRVYYTSRFRIDSDEPQHLHVVWAWLQGLLPYRDVFDNHAPLFQFLCAPILRLVGERADSLIWMRWAMLPFQLIVLRAVFVLGRALFSTRTGLWAAVLTGYQPRFFLTSTEFRPDDLWVALWMVALWILLTGSWSLRWAWWCGVVLGAALAVSIKTILLLAALTVGAILSVLAMLFIREPVGWRRIIRLTMAGLAGLLILPGIVCAAFAARGAWREFVYCTMSHNLVPGLGRWSAVPRWEHWSFPLFIGLALPMSCWLVKAGPTPQVALRRSILLNVTGSLITLLYSYWPLIERETLLVFIPPALLLVAALIVLPMERTMALRWKRGLPLTNLAPSALAFWLLMLTLEASPPGKNRTEEFTRHVETVLRLTNRDDYVMDAKGESIYRRRPYYYALEPITEARIRAGLMEDDLIERMCATRTCVTALHRLRGKNLHFVMENYLQVSNSLLVAGRWVKRKTAVFEFENRIAARYTLVAKSGPVSGTIDGISFKGPVFLGEGPHRIEITGPRGKVALIWAQASDRGFSAFGDFATDPTCGLNVDS